MEIYLVRFLESLLIPPGSLILLMLLGTFALRRWYRTGTLMVLAGFLGLLVASLPITAQGLLYLLEITPPINPAALEKPSAGAIVVLGAGRRYGALELEALGTDTRQTLTPLGLERLRYAVLLHRKTGLPLLLSGGMSYGEEVSEAQLMQQVLSDSFGVRARWLEGQSANTWQNAVNCKALLKQVGIDQVILVTHAWHMERAMMAFHSNGLGVTPAPMGFSPHVGDGPLLPGFLPNAHALWQTSFALREWLGQTWYRLRYNAASPSLVVPEYLPEN